MISTLLADANVIIRFLLNDHPKLSQEAKTIFSKAEKGVIKIYLDEVVLAEVVWTLSSFYKVKKTDLVDKLEKLLSQDWIINPRKSILFETLDLYKRSNVEYIDCWIFVVSKAQRLKLETFDKKLKKLRSK